MGKPSRTKGAAYERCLAHIFEDLGFKDAKRHLESQPQEAGQGRDLDGTQPFAVQAKCWKSTPSISAIDEIIPTEEYPVRVAILKRTQSKGRSGLEVAVIDLNVFMNIVTLLQHYVDEFNRSCAKDGYEDLCLEDLAEDLLWE